MSIQSEAESERTYAAVAENISTLFASVNRERANEKIDVKTITRPIRRSIRFTKYRTRIAIVGSNDPKIALTELLMVSILSSSYCLKVVPGYGDESCCSFADVRNEEY